MFLLCEVDALEPVDDEDVSVVIGCDVDVVGDDATYGEDCSFAMVCDVEAFEQFVVVSMLVCDAEVIGEQVVVVLGSVHVDVFVAPMLSRGRRSCCL